MSELIQLSFPGPPPCHHDSVKVYDGSSEGSRLLGMFCGPELPQNVTSSSNTMLVRMKTDSLHNHIGFSANWESVEESVTQMPKRILGKFCIHVKVFSLQVKMNLAVVKQLKQLLKKKKNRKILRLQRDSNP